MNVAAKAVLFAELVGAACPFLLLVGAAPNATAYNSEQLMTGELYVTGIPASIMLMAVATFGIAIF